MFNPHKKKSNFEIELENKYQRVTNKEFISRTKNSDNWDFEEEEDITLELDCKRFSDIDTLPTETITINSNNPKIDDCGIITKIWLILENAETDRDRNLWDRDFIISWYNTFHQFSFDILILLAKLDGREFIWEDGSIRIPILVPKLFYGGGFPLYKFTKHSSMFFIRSADCYYDPFNTLYKERYLIDNPGWRIEIEAVPKSLDNFYVEQPYINSTYCEKRVVYGKSNWFTSYIHGRTKYIILGLPEDYDLEKIELAYHYPKNNDPVNFLNEELETQKLVFDNGESKNIRMQKWRIFGKLLVGLPLSADLQEDSGLLKILNPSKKPKLYDCRTIDIHFWLYSSKEEKEIRNIDMWVLSDQCWFHST